MEELEEARQEQRERPKRARKVGVGARLQDQTVWPRQTKSCEVTKPEAANDAKFRHYSHQNPVGRALAHSLIPLNDKTAKVRGSGRSE